MPEPITGFLVGSGGMGSTLTGGHCGSAVDTLLKLEVRAMSGVLGTLSVVLYVFGEIDNPVRSLGFS